ncbi:MAG: hypothetical protein HKM05_12315 [Spirochaetales bacterium]|nr:hypothetical protein [Spirochaetales bacterium]
MGKILAALAAVLILGSCVQPTGSGSSVSPLSGTSAVVSSVVSIKTPSSVPTNTLSTNAKLPTSVSNSVVLDAWMWSFSDIEANLANIAAAGYNAVEVSPLEPIKQSATLAQWYLLYQPCDLTIGNPTLGNETGFKNLTTAAASYGISIIVDAVLNQTADNGTPGGFDPHVASYIQAHQKDWFHNNPTVANWENRMQETQYDLGNGPDWNTQNTTVQSLMLGFLNQCIADGAGGFRFDAAKSIETNAGVDAGASWTGVQSSPVTLYQWDPVALKLTTTPYANTGSGNFWDDVLPNLTNRSNLFLYGEVIQDVNDAADNENGYQTYFRTTATNVIGQLANAYTKANLTGLATIPASSGSGEDPTKIVVYTENWDNYTGGLYNTAGQSYAQRLVENAILTARAGMVNILFVRPGEGLWYDPVMVAVNWFHNLMAGDSEYLEYAGNGAPSSMTTALLAIKRQSGGVDAGMVLVNAASSAQTITVSTSFAPGTYPDRGPSGDTFSVKSGVSGVSLANGSNTLTGTVPAQSAVVLVP